MLAVFRLRLAELPREIALHALRQRRIGVIHEGVVLALAHEIRRELVRRRLRVHPQEAHQLRVPLHLIRQSRVGIAVPAAEAAGEQRAVAQILAVEQLRIRAAQLIGRVDVFPAGIHGVDGECVEIIARQSPVQKRRCAGKLRLAVKPF